VQDLLHAQEPRRHPPHIGFTGARQDHQHLQHDPFGGERGEVITLLDLAGQTSRTLGHPGVVSVRSPVEKPGEGAKQLGLGGIGLNDDHLRTPGADVVRVLLAGRLGENRGRRAMEAPAVDVQVEGSSQHDRDAGSVMRVTDEHVTRSEPGLDDVESIQAE
jgi:hypothetical protein